MAKMFLVCGISGVGKTTLSKRMEKKHGLMFFGIDEFYTKVNGDDKDRRNKFDVWIEFFKAIHTAEEQQIDCVIEISGLTRHQRREFVEWFPTFEHHLIFIEAAAELRNKNNLSRDRKVPAWRIADMENKTQRPNADDDYDQFDSITFFVNKDNQFSPPMVSKGEWQFDEVNYNE